MKPQSGDIYKVQISNSEYTLYKVGRAFNDSMYLYRSEEYVNKVSGLDDLLKETTYSDEAESVSVKELKQMFENKKIIGVNRQ